MRAVALELPFVFIIHVLVVDESQNETGDGIIRRVKCITDDTSSEAVERNPCVYKCAPYRHDYLNRYITIYKCLISKRRHSKSFTIIWRVGRGGGQERGGQLREEGKRNVGRRIG